MSFTNQSQGEVKQNQSNYCTKFISHSTENRPTGGGGGGGLIQMTSLSFSVDCAFERGGVY